MFRSGSYSNSAKEIVQLDKYLSLIKIWGSIIEAIDCIGVKNISRSIKKNHLSGGFRWMYLEDYNKLKLNKNETN